LRLGSFDLSVPVIGKDAAVIVLCVLLAALDNMRDVEFLLIRLLIDLRQGTLIHAEPFDFVKEETLVVEELGLDGLPCALLRLELFLIDEGVRHLLIGHIVCAVCVIA